MNLKLLSGLLLVTAGLSQNVPAANWIVYMTDSYSFNPSSLTIQVGDTVTWVNYDEYDSHNATATDGSWSSGEVDPFYEATVTYNQAGTYPFKDTVWGALGMTGTLTVKAPVLVAPTISLPSPPAGTVFHTKSLVTLEARPVTTGSDVVQVEFFSGSTFLGAVTTAPWSLVVSNWSAKVHSITAKVTDSKNQVATSPAVSISVVTPAALKVALSKGAGSLNLNFSTTAGLTYVLEKCSILGGTWTGISTNTANANSMTVSRSYPAVNEFYRVRLK